jgi:hypothetical protein
MSNESNPSSSEVCAICTNKSVTGVFKCQGCLQTFCLKHTNEHRENLRQQLDELLFENKQVFHDFNRHEHLSSKLVNQIDRWEHDAIKSIQKMAQCARIQTQQYAHKQLG